MQQDEQKYNGWTNYETWATALWLDNDEGSQSYWRDVAAQCGTEAPTTSQVKEGLWSVQEATRFSLADRLKEEVADGAPDTIEASLYGDLLGAALSSVNWHEIAEHWLENLES